MTNDYGNLELHKVLLSAMKDIDMICRENGLRYYLHAGTLLGAFNHQGFIPWDDDVDISMLREDYEKFINIVSQNYSEKYFIHNYKTERTFSHNRSVMRVLGTEIVHNNDNCREEHREIGLDIVPLDAAPDSIILRKIQQKMVWIVDLAVQIKVGAVEPRRFVTRLIGVLAKMDRVKLGKMIDMITTWYNGKNTKYIGLLSYTGKNPYTGRNGYENDLLLREWFDNPIMVQFEDTKFLTISEPIKDLKHRYGENWYEPYPEEKRVTKHDVLSYTISEEVRERVGL